MQKVAQNVQLKNFSEFFFNPMICCNLHAIYVKDIKLFDDTQIPISKGF